MPFLFIPLYFLLFAFFLVIAVVSKNFRSVAIGIMVAMLVIPAGLLITAILYVVYAHPAVEM